MEKTNFKTDGVFDETTKMANKWLADTCSVMTNIYDKQLKTTLGFYDTLFNSFSGTEKDGQAHSNFIPSFFAGTEIFKSMLRPFNSFASNGNSLTFFTSQLGELYKQMSEFNSKLFASMQEDLKNRQSDWNELREKYNKIIEEQWRFTQNMVNSLQEIYVKQMNHSMELNKKLQREMNEQFEQAADRNKKIWSDLTKTNGTTDKSEKENEPERKDGTHKKQGRGELIHH